MSHPLRVEKACVLVGVLLQMCIHDRMPCISHTEDLNRCDRRTGGVDRNHMAADVYSCSGACGYPHVRGLCRLAIADYLWKEDDSSKQRADWW